MFLQMNLTLSMSPLTTIGWASALWLSLAMSMNAMMMASGMTTTSSRKSTGITVMTSCTTADIAVQGKLIKGRRIIPPGTQSISHPLRNWKLDAAGLPKSRAHRPVVKAPRHRQNRTAVQSIRRTATLDACDYWTNRLAGIPTSEPTQHAISKAEQAAIMARQAPVMLPFVLRDPASQRQSLLEQLQYRDITPEDYSVLLELDEQIQAK